MITIALTAQLPLALEVARQTPPQFRCCVVTTYGRWCLNQNISWEAGKLGCFIIIHWHPDACETQPWIVCKKSCSSSKSKNLTRKFGSKLAANNGTSWSETPELHRSNAHPKKKVSLCQRCLLSIINLSGAPTTGWPKDGEMEAWNL